MIRTILIDDEPLARSIVKEYLSAYPQIEVVQECNDGFEGVKAISQHKPDLLFLDIQMPKITGFEMLELLDEPPAIIFTTAFDEYAIKAFDNHAVDYLLKPFSKERFDKAITKFLQSPATKNTPSESTALQYENPDTHNRVVIKNGNSIKIIPVNDILYLEAYDDYVKIHTKEGYFLKKKTMQYFENTLNPADHVRVHRSYIIKTSEIMRIDSHDSLRLKNGIDIPLSKTGYAKLKSILGI